MSPTIPAPNEPGADTPTCIIRQTHLTDLPVFQDIFDPSRPVEVDIGCGKGRFLLARAAAHPDIQYLGIERLLLRVRKIDRKAQRGGLGNLRLIRLEAAYTLQYFIPEHAVRRFYLFFPDPWPKRRHHKRRLFSPEFLDVLHDRLMPGGTVQVATDHLDYFAEIRKTLAGDSRFREVPPIPRLPEEQTDFELIFRGNRQPIGECAFQI